MDLGLAGKKAVITGSTRGIGRAIANLLADEGADLAICARHQDEVDSAVSELGARGVKVTGAVVDVVFEPVDWLTVFFFSSDFRFGA